MLLVVRKNSVKVRNPFASPVGVTLAIQNLEGAGRIKAKRRRIKVLDRERLPVRAAPVRTGIAAADFSRIRNADLARFTVDRLMSILNRLGSRTSSQRWITEQS